LHFDNFIIILKLHECKTIATKNIDVWESLVLATYFYIEAFEFTPFFEGYVMSLFSFYISVLFIRAGKEALTYILNNLVVWLFDVFKNIGLFIKNMWLLNIVIKKK